MVNNVILRSLLYFCTFLSWNNAVISTSSSITLYSSFRRMVEQLSSNSTLPHCTISTCAHTETQANFSDIELSDESLLKLASYEKVHQKNSITRGPYLIASTGIYRGKRVKYNRRYVDQFLGIYYAESPGTLKKPVKKQFQYSIQNATNFSPCCLQSAWMARNLSYGSFTMQTNFDANCLTLNIYRADLRYGEKRKAIMLFSHGGSNQLGSGSLFDGSVLASEGDIIVITMNFRLNYHGFLSSGDHRVGGNYGLWDQSLAVEWIHENAHLFGGDPDRLVLAGHSAGAGNVMLIPASPHCRGMVRRVISQSGSALAPWSINRNPLKLLKHFSEKFACNLTDTDEMIDCISKLSEHRNGNIYNLYINLTIADDNPYPVIDNDFVNDTVENVLQSDAFQNIDFLTGVTLNEGLYFAEYHIRNLYNDRSNDSLTASTSLSAEKHSITSSNSSTVISPDIIFTDTAQSNEDDIERRPELPSADPRLHLEEFAKVDYIDRYINANFHNSKCFLDQVKDIYQSPAQDNVTNRLELYINLVSDLMFNFHMVRGLNLRVHNAHVNASNYAYIYSHRPTFRVQSTYRDQLKVLPHAVGHFAELDYVFGVPLAVNYSRIHRNVNMSYYNYSSDEENFSRKVIRYWANFIKTGNPNKDSVSTSTTNDIEWKPYTRNEHNYLDFQVNNIHNKHDYFDRMYDFWSESFRLEKTGVCKKMGLNKPLSLFLFVFLLVSLVLIIYFIWKYFQKRKLGHFLPPRSPTTTLLPSSNRVSA